MEKLLMFFIFCIFFCTCQKFKDKDESKRNISKYQIVEQCPSEKDIVISDHKQFTEGGNIIQNNKFLELLKQHYDYVAIKSNIKNETSIINDQGKELYKIASGTGITILAKSYMDTYDNNISIREYIVLVKINNKPELWSGWLKHDLLDIETLNILKRESIAPLNPGSISPDNKKIVLTNYKGNKEFKIIDNNGNDIFNLSSEQVVGKDGQWLTSVIGWSDNSQNVWLNVYSYRCIYIQLIDKYYRLFEIPDISNAENLDITPVIDFNTGDYYYTDYDPRVLRGRDTEEYWNEYKKQTFHLYKYNFFDGEKTELESIYGNGFILTAKDNKRSIIKGEI